MSPVCATGGKVVAWLSARGCRDAVGQCAMREHQGLRAMPVAPSHCASSTGAERVVHRAGTDLAFGRGSDGRQCANPWWDMGRKIWLSAACRGGKGMVRQMQRGKVAPFTLGFPAESRLLVQFGWQRPYCCRLSTHQLSSPVSAAKLHPPRWPRLTLGLAELTVIGGPKTLPARLAGRAAGHPSSLCLDLCWCSSKPKQVFIRARAMNS